MIYARSLLREQRIACNVGDQHDFFEAFAAPRRALRRVLHWAVRSTRRRGEEATPATIFIEVRADHAAEGTGVEFKVRPQWEPYVEFVETSRGRGNANFYNI